MQNLKSLPLKDKPGRNPVYLKIGKRIRQARLMARETNSRELSLRLGWSAGRIHNYESGLSTPRVEETLQFCEALQVDPAWITYGIGSESQNLPGFVVLQSGPRGPRGGGVNWASGFLPTTYQGVPLRGQGSPILNLTNPPGITATRQRRTLDALRDLNLRRLVLTGDEEINTRIAAYEMAYRMQTSAPELIDLTGESQHTMQMYGAKSGESSFANNCLLARRETRPVAQFLAPDQAGQSKPRQRGQMRLKWTRKKPAALFRDI